MSYADIVDGLHVVFGTVIDIQTLIIGEPKSLNGELPALYTRFESVSDEARGQVTLRKYRSLHRICFKWQENEYAEEELQAVLDEVLDAIDDDPQLGDTLAYGVVTITDGQAGWVTIDGVEYRCLDLYTEALEKSS